MHSELYSWKQFANQAMLGSKYPEGIQIIAQAAMLIVF
jgi:hypothetical protein